MNGKARGSVREDAWSMRAARILLVTIFLFPSVNAFAAAPDSFIRFDTPAEKFTQSLPLGNGRLGAMAFGGVAEERIVLNESPLSSGSRQDTDKPDAAKHLPEIRRLLLKGKNVEAERLVYKNSPAAAPVRLEARARTRSTALTRYSAICV